VLPYIAPEVLQGKGYTQASDIYSLGIIAYELLSHSYPYPDLKDLCPNLITDKERELQFALDVIGRRLRPNIDSIPLPQLLKNLIMSN
jgi:serine/threonine protein kinase